MIDYNFTRVAHKEFLRTPQSIQKRIIEKLEFYLAQPNPLSFAQKIVSTQSTYRFRVGDYRVVFDWEEDSILILRIGHRRDIYR